MTKSLATLDEAITPPREATVLLVDDDLGNRQLFGWLLREAGYHVLEAGTGGEALGLAHHSPDIVVLDVNLPDISGFEVCERLRQLPPTRDAGVVHLSAVHVDSSDRMHGLDSGADAYLIKPIEPRELLAHIRAVLRTRAAEAAARNAAREWRATFDAIQDAVCLVDLEGRIRRCNQALCRWLGQDFSSLIDRRLDPSLRAGLHLAHDPALAVLARGKTRSVSEWNLGPRWYEVTADPMRDDDGTLVGGVLILTDITRRRELEEQLAQAQRHEAIAQLAGGVAHDFNNLLTAIVGNASLLLDALPVGSPEHERLSAIERAAWRGSDLTRQLLGFARKTLLWLRLIDPATILADAQQRIRRSLPERIRLVVEVAPDLWPVQADSSQLSHIVLQLALDAIEALQGAGQILLQAANVEINGEAALDRADARAGSFVRLSVRDDGPVIAPERIASIFDPFAGGKPVARSAGMGLAMVQGIIKQHQGWAECTSSPERGTWFHLYLPRAGSRLSLAQLTPATAAFPTGVHVILLVDEDPILGNLAAAYLRRAGFEVLLAEDVPVALETYRAEHARITLILLNEAVACPDLVEEFRLIRPSARVSLVVEDDRDVTGAIKKPYRERELVEAVHAALSPL
jgi:two-component system, cell cycle sensor histidine kinase and response regulator CckA